MKLILDTGRAAYEFGVKSLQVGGLFRGERAVIIRDSPVEGYVYVTLPNSLHPKEEHCVPKSCLTEMKDV